MNATIDSIINTTNFFTEGELACESFVVTGVTPAITTFPASATSLLPLIDAAKPATFGRADETVFDESYRKALTIHTEDFHTTFDINQLANKIKTDLFPNVNEMISLQRYRLNIYQEGGHFKDHLDTPKAGNFMGSVVVCLPSKFTGGVFHISHNGVEKVIDWSVNSHVHHQWVAFYGDCKHSIDPVESGTRVTITYDIYSNVLSSAAGNEVFRSELRKFIGAMTIDDDVMYATTSSHMYAAINSPLKGYDSILFEVLQELNLNPVIGHVVYTYVDDKLFVFGPGYVERGIDRYASQGQVDNREKALLE